MDDSERAIEIALAASHGERYGTADVSPSGVDRSLLRANLRLTPTQRLQQLAHLVDAWQSLQGIAKRASR